jgi:Amt family ammonium transporter
MEEKQFRPVVPQSNPVQMLFGTLILWFGWYGFNAGSTAALSSDMDLLAEQICMVTTIGAAAGGLGGFTASMMEGLLADNHPKVEIPDLCCGILGGLVGVTAGCNLFDSMTSLAIGLSCGIIAVATCRIFDYLHIDDAVGAFAVHGVCGIIGTMLIPFFAVTSCMNPTDLGVLMGGNRWDLVWVHCYGTFAICAWGCCCSYCTCLFCELIPGFSMRADRTIEICGLDLTEHKIMSDSGVRLHS